MLSTPEYTPMTPGQPQLGAFGLHLRGAPVKDLQGLVPIPSGLDWPVVEIGVMEHEPKHRPDHVSDDAADIALGDGVRAVIQRSPGSATLHAASALDDGTLVHPFLTVVGTVFGWWHGHEAVHGGAFIGAGGAWGVVGDRNTGKSSLLAALSAAGRRVLSDDLLVISDGEVLAGPRCIDLRMGAADALGIESAKPVRGGDRYRVALPDVEPAAPLVGWVFLSWGEPLVLRSLSPSERLPLLAPQWHPGNTRTALMNLAALPAWELQRPKSWQSMDLAVDRLLRLADGHG